MTETILARRETCLILGRSRDIYALEEVKMFEPDKIKSMISEAFDVTHVEVNDLTGTKDHYSVLVVSPEFSGKLPLKQHRMVNAALAAPLASGEIHALQLKTLTPDEWSG